MISISRRKLELQGKRFGRLKVIELSEMKNRDGKRLWRCLCDCQKDLPETERKYKYITGSNLVSGKTNSCGCLQAELRGNYGKKNKKYNIYDMESYLYGVGWTKNGYEFYFDKEDYNLIYPYCWHKHQDGYLRTCNEVLDDGRHKYIMMHQLIAKKYGFKYEVDHVNGKPYDNRKENMRDILHKDNSKNVKLYKTNTSGHKGVHREKRSGKWKAYIHCDNQRIHLGTFNDYESAVLAREKAEKLYHGEYNREKRYL